MTPCDQFKWWTSFSTEVNVIHNTTLFHNNICFLRITGLHKGALAIIQLITKSNYNIMQKPDCYQTDLLDIRNKNAQHKLSKWQFIQCISIILLVHWKDAQAMREKEINGKKDYHSKISFFTYGRLRGLPQVYLTGTPHTVQGGYHQDEKKRLVWFFCCGLSMLHSVDVHKSPDEASAKKSYNDHCIRIDRSTAFPPTSAQDPSVHFRMAILLKQVVQEKMRQRAGRDKQETLPLV